MGIDMECFAVCIRCSFELRKLFGGQHLSMLIYILCSKQLQIKQTMNNHRNSKLYVVITVLRIQYLRQNDHSLANFVGLLLKTKANSTKASQYCVYFLFILAISHIILNNASLQEFIISLLKFIHKCIRKSHLALKSIENIRRSFEVFSYAFSIKYNKFQSQRNMSSEDIVHYLIEIGSNERKLQYCRQILSQNSSFTPQVAFNINTSQNKTTLFKSQLLELFMSTGLTSKAQELELIFQYFQIDGKNFVTLQQFSTILLPQTQIPQNNNKKCEKYQLKYSLQKFFLQILENQALLDRHNKLKKKDQQGIPKAIFKKLTLDHLKSFLTFHGKYPSRSMLEDILKELLLNKGSGNRSKFVTQYIVQFNESGKFNIAATKMEQEKQIERKNMLKIPKISAEAMKSDQKTQNPVTKKHTFNSILPLNQNIIPDPTKLNDNVPRAQKTEISSVQERIKSLMSSVNMTVPAKNQVARQIPRKQTSSNKIKEVQIDIKKKPLQTQRQFGQIKLRQNFNLEDRQRVCKKTLIQDNDFSYKMKKYKKSKVISQDNGDNISFDQQSRHIFCTNADSMLTIQTIKQNQATVKQKYRKDAKNQKSKRISYLKSLVGENSAEKPKNVQTYRI